MTSRLLRALANSRIGLRARHFTGMFPPAYPFLPDLDEVVSDLFLWRSDARWETHFDLCHLAGLVNPRMHRPYEVLIRLHDAGGGVIDTHIREVHYGTVQTLGLEELVGPRQGHGTFSVFHLVNAAEVFGTERTCLTERGYVSYRRRGDPLRSYVHGNLYGAGCHPVTRRIRNLGAKSRRDQAYRPQVRLDDCEYAELALCNFSDESIEVAVDAMNGGSKGGQYLLAPSASLLLDTRSALAGCALASLRSKVAFLRPLIFKHYETHFDVLHG